MPHTVNSPQDIPFGVFGTCYAAVTAVLRVGRFDMFACQALAWIVAEPFSVGTVAFAVDGIFDVPGKSSVEGLGHFRPQNRGELAVAVELVAFVRGRHSRELQR